MNAAQTCQQRCLTHQLHISWQRQVVHAPWSRNKVHLPLEDNGCLPSTDHTAVSDYKAECAQDARGIRSAQRHYLSGTVQIHNLQVNDWIALWRGICATTAKVVLNKRINFQTSAAVPLACSKECMLHCRLVECVCETCEHVAAVAPSFKRSVTCHAMLSHANCLNSL